MAMTPTRLLLCLLPAPLFAVGCGATVTPDDGSGPADGGAVVDQSGAPADARFDVDADCDNVACPSLSGSCLGPWSTQGRPDAGSCPPPRQLDADGGAGCVQVVLGRFNDVKQYIDCPGYVVLNLAAYTVQRNDEFIACAAAGELGATCAPGILIASPDENIPVPPTMSHIPTELCQLRACSCHVTVQSMSPGSVTSCSHPVPLPIPLPDGGARDLRGASR